jgi:hypothetical protein
VLSKIKPVEKYFMKEKSSPFKKEGVQQNSDPHIDQDFTGYPHLPADKKSILWLANLGARLNKAS